MINDYLGLGSLRMLIASLPLFKFKPSSLFKFVGVFSITRVSLTNIFRTLQFSDSF
jgi:hypothetical protein